MGAQFETIEVPFQLRGNRRYLTAKQLAEDSSVYEFVCRFRNCFEYNCSADAYVLIEQDDIARAAALSATPGDSK